MSVVHPDYPANNEEVSYNVSVDGSRATVKLGSAQGAGDEAVYSLQIVKDGTALVLEVIPFASVDEVPVRVGLQRKM
ncbi:MAG: hypothetical protein IPK26_17775 [Planctomycetes bacterium]|nr:hypothetical protein [Planctomycetota bacterium]